MPEAKQQLPDEKLPEIVTAWLGQRRYEESAPLRVERGAIRNACAAVENGNPIYWNDEEADMVCGGGIAPPSLISAWLRPYHWTPESRHERKALRTHFDLKKAFHLPEGVITNNTLIFYTPVRIGDQLRTAQVLQSVSPVKTIKLGRGRFWVIDSIIENQFGELCAVDRYTGLGYERVEKKA